MESSGMSVKQFSVKYADTVTIHFHMISFSGGVYVWTGLSSGALLNFAVAIPTRFDDIPASTELLSSAVDTSSTLMAQRIAKRTGLQVFISCDLPSEPRGLQSAVERRILQELRQNSARAEPQEEVERD
eukprot:m.631894 g.631894  ORF g.631894 m.631894 type:complete len:129 (+) comp22574_c0_seq4:293-679(+)